MITILEHPKTFDFAENPIAFCVQGTNLYKTQGTKAGFKFHKISNTIVVNDFFDIPLPTGEIIKLTVKASPDDTGTQISNSIDLSIKTNEFKSNYYIDKYYNVTYDSANIIFQTKEYNTISFSNTSINCSAFERIDTETGISPVVNENYRFLMNIPSVGDFYFDSNEDNLAVIRLDDLLNSYLSIDLPDFNQNSIKKCSNVLKTWKINFAESYGVIPVLSRFYQSDEFTLIKGKLNFKDFPNHDFLTYLETSKIFLNSLPDCQEIYKDSQIFLYLLCGNYDSITARFVLYNVDGSTSLKYINLQNVKLLDLVMIPAGFNQLELDKVDTSKTVYYYTVEMFSTGGIAASEIRTFKLIDKPIIGKTFLFENKFGLLESLICEGDLQIKRNTKRKVVETQLPYNYTKTEGNYKSKTIETSQELQAYTGYKETHILMVIDEFFKTSEFYFQDTDSFTKCILTDDNYEILPKQNEENSVKFSYRFAYND